VSREIINTDRAPAAIGPYSQAVRHNGTVYVSGQIPLDPESGEIVGGGIEAQIAQVFSNLAAVAKAADTSLDNALKITVYLTDLSHFGLVNEHMTKVFRQPYPARAAIEVTGLPKGADVEADAIIAS
jgi:reactive intermediate/imine deaminase